MASKSQNRGSVFLVLNNIRKEAQQKQLHFRNKLNKLAGGVSAAGNPHCIVRLFYSQGARTTRLPLDSFFLIINYNFIP